MDIKTDFKILMINLLNTQLRCKSIQLFLISELDMFNNFKLSIMFPNLVFFLND